MPFKLRVQHMDRDFQIQDQGVDPWETEIADDEELIIFLNRLAISSSHTVSIEHPEVEISVGSKRTTVKAIKGQLFFSDLNKVHIQNLRVIAEEIVGFLTDRITPGAIEIEGELEEDSKDLPRYRDQGRRTADAIRASALAILFAVLAFCSFQVWKTMSHEPSLVRPPDFVAGMVQAEAFLERHGGTYVLAIKDAGRVIEIDPSGRFRLYEIWRKPDGNGYRLNRIEDLPVAVGMSNGRESFLASDFYLVIPDAEGRVEMFGQLFEAYDRKRDLLGLYPENEG